MTKDEMPTCPVATTVQIIGSKWKLLIMRNLLARPWRFNELKKDLEGISQKVLTDSLRSGIRRGAAARGIRPLPAWGIHAAHYYGNAAVGARLSNNETGQRRSFGDGSIKRAALKHK